MEIKLIIWDLDDTLWNGVLAEGESVQPLLHRFRIIQRLNQHGIISSICSRNDPAIAQQKLRDLQMLDEFVFSRFEFASKGPIVSQMIADMQLQPENVLFIDNDVHNLEEVRHVLPQINIVNSVKEECDQLLAEILENNKRIAKNRVEQYRMLEKRISDRRQQPANNEDFLRSCDIHAAVVHRTDNMEFSERIEELINRSNQLNYTKSRVEKGSIIDLMATGDRNYGYSLFVWDKYGYHGLVGFASLEKCSSVRHFVFSCRVMNMGLESWFLHHIKKFYPVDTSNLPIEPKEVDWVHEEKFYDPAIRWLIWEKEKEKVTANITLRIMAQCASGALAHYSGLNNVVDPDNTWKSFSLTRYLNANVSDEKFPPMLVYAVSVDYDQNIWDNLNALDRYRECVIEFCKFIRNNDKKLLVILTPQDIPPEKQNHARRADQTRMRYCNDIWREMVVTHKEISIIEVAEIATDDDIIDNYHYGVELLKKLGERIGHWYERECLVQSEGAHSRRCSASV